MKNQDVLTFLWEEADELDDEWIELMALVRKNEERKTRVLDLILEAEKWVDKDGDD